MPLYFEKYGMGIPLVMLHGFTGSAQTWHPFINPLSDKSQLLLIDLPGHGKSVAMESYTMPFAAQAVATLIQQECDPPIHLLGYSMGGRLALYIAIHYPHLISRLILESSSPGLATEKERIQRQQRDNQLAEQLEQNGIACFVEYWENIPLFETQNELPQFQRENLRSQRLQNSPTELANSLRGMGTGVQPSLWNALATLQMPITLMAGEHDAKFVKIAQQMNQEIPHGTLHLIADAGHTIHLEQPRKFGQVVKETV